MPRRIDRSPRLTQAANEELERLRLELGADEPINTASDVWPLQPPVVVVNAQDDSVMAVVDPTGNVPSAISARWRYNILDLPILGAVSADIAATIRDPSGRAIDYIDSITPIAGGPARFAVTCLPCSYAPMPGHTYLQPFEMDLHDIRPGFRSFLVTHDGLFGIRLVRPPTLAGTPRKILAETLGGFAGGGNGLAFHRRIDE